MISVVIPLFNKEHSISATLQSVLDQTYDDFEVVVVDDGSTDNSAVVVSGFTDKRIRLIRKSNGGVSSARNEGILEAKGEYIAFLDGDDIWDSHYLEQLVKLIIDYPNATIYGLGCGYIENGKKELQSSQLVNGYRGVVKDVWNNYPGCWTGSSTCSSRANLISVGMFDTRMSHGEDMDMWWRLLLKGDGVIDGTGVWAYYVQDSENRAMGKFIPFEKHIPFYIEKFEKWRKENASFRKFCDQECLYRLFQYTLMPQYKKDLRRVLGQIDFSQQKMSMRLRFLFPRLYRLHVKKRNR